MKANRLFSWPILMVIILAYVMMLSVFLWVTNIGGLNAFIITIPFLLLTCLYVILFIKYIKMNH